MSQKIDLKLKGYGKNSYPKVVDTEFTQLIQSVETESEVGFVTNEQFFDIYNDRFVKRYLVALMKRQWGQNLIKFRGVKLPGGLELNGREIYEDGERELQEIKSKMALEYETPPLDFIG